MTPEPPAVLITRPEPDASAFATRLRAAAPGSWRLVVSPLSRTQHEVPPPIPADAALILTSRNAVRALGDRGDGRTAWCVGTATAGMARRVGLNPMPVAAGGDADALVHRIIAARPTGPLLHLRGEETRGDVAQRLRAAGLTASEAVVYRQIAVPPSAEARRLLAECTPVLAPVFSPRGAERLSAVVPEGRPVDVVALSPAVAAALTLSGSAQVAAHPDAASMIAALIPRLSGANA